MKLFFKKTGEGKPLLILHGLFGLGDNWSSIARSFSEKGYCCYTIDQRNHGRSPHSSEFSYNAMAEDLFELINDESISKADIIGHSMGGKTAMFFSMQHAERIRKMIIADIAPRYYNQHHQTVISALESIEVSDLSSRKEAEAQLRLALNDESTIQFLLKNLYWKDDNKLDWRFGLKEIEKNIEEIGKGLPSGSDINVPVLFLKGEQSSYISKDDLLEIKKRFPNSDIKDVPGAGHWVHAENPKVFLEMALEFLER